MTRQTSIDAYNAIKTSGVLSERRWQVYDVVFRYGPLTSGEGFRFLNEANPIRNLTQSRARFTELREMGFLKENCIRTCKVTGHKAIEWEVTNDLPQKIEKQKELAAKDAAKITLDFILYTMGKLDIKNYPDVANVRRLWKYCESKTRKK